MRDTRPSKGSHRESLEPGLLEPSPLWLTQEDCKFRPTGVTSDPVPKLKINCWGYSSVWKPWGRDPWYWKHLWSKFLTETGFSMDRTGAGAGVQWHSACLAGTRSCCISITKKKKSINRPGLDTFLQLSHSPSGLSKLYSSKNGEICKSAQPLLSLSAVLPAWDLWDDERCHCPAVPLSLLGLKSVADFMACTEQLMPFLWCCWTTVTNDGTVGIDPGALLKDWGRYPASELRVVAQYIECNSCFQRQALPM